VRATSISYSNVEATFPAKPQIQPVKRLARSLAAGLRASRSLCRVFWKTSALRIPGLRKVKCNICGWGGRRFADYDCGFGHIYRDAAFSIQEDMYINSLGDDLIRYHGLQATPLFLCARPE
jgi:hypothetical protein